MTATVGITAARRRRHAVIEILQCAPLDSFPEDMLDVPHKGPVLGRHKGKGVTFLRGTACTADPVRPPRMSRISFPHGFPFDKQNTFCHGVFQSKSSAQRSQ
jgi:hypothetical protein